MKAVSAKRRAITPERRSFVAATLAARPRCEFRHITGTAAGRMVEDRSTGRRWTPPACTGAATEVHEKLLRSRGGAIVPSQGLQPQDVVALCHACHAWVTTHPAGARAFGLERHSWERRPEP